MTAVTPEAQELMAAFDADRHATEARDEVLARMDRPLPGDGFLLAAAEARHAELMRRMGAPKPDAAEKEFTHRWVKDPAQREDVLRVKRLPNPMTEMAGPLLNDLVRDAVDEVLRALAAGESDEMRLAVEAYQVKLAEEAEQPEPSRLRYRSSRWQEIDEKRLSDDAWADLTQGLSSELVFGVHVAEKLGLALLDAAAPDLRRVA